MTDPSEGATSAELRSALCALVLDRGYRRSDTPFTLSSGGQSHDYVDLRRAVSEGSDLRLAARSVLAYLDAAGIAFDVIGGMTMGADPVSHAVALLSNSRWYSVRKAEKTHGTGQRIEGSVVGPGVRAVVFEDTTSTGRSLLDAVDVVRASGATIVAALTLLDRGANTPAAFAGSGVEFHSILTYADLGIDPIGGAGAKA